jgi:ABC-type antimicrobial peptide transport system permease subunit
MRTVIYFIAKDLIHDRGRSLLTILSLAVVVVGYLLLASLAQAFAVFGNLSQVTGNLVIVAADALDPMESSLNEDILQTAQQVTPDQIQRTFPVIFRHLNIQGKTMQVCAVPLDEMPTALSLTLVDGSWPSAQSERQIVISESIAQATSWKIGTSVNIYGEDFQVTGLVRSGGNDYGVVWMTYTEGQRLFGMKRGFQIGYIPLVPLADPESVRQRLQADPRISTHYTVYLENALSARYSQFNHNLLTLSNLLALVSLSAITFGIYNATSLSLNERGREISLLRVIGFTQSRLRGFLFARILVLTLVGYSLGWVTALLLINYLGIQSPSDMLVAPVVLDLTPSISLLGLVMATIFAFLGIWLTTGRLATLNPLTRNE